MTNAAEGGPAQDTLAVPSSPIYWLRYKASTLQSQLDDLQKELSPVLGKYFLTTAIDQQKREYRNVIDNNANGSTNPSGKPPSQEEIENMREQLSKFKGAIKWFLDFSANATPYYP